MSRAILGRIERIERQQMTPEQWIAWEDDDGSVVYLEGCITHEEALAMLD